MILAADVGVGIVGKEGKQASLAADFSITQFSYVLPLLLWHGRNSYKRSARLSQFVIHRGLIISIIQAVFSALFYFAAIPIYNGWLMVGYATFYTMLPVFSLVLDEDVDENKVYLYPELYKDLQKGRPLSFKTFFIWLFQSVYQGGVIMIGSIVLFESRFLNIVSITFTALLASELVNVALEVHKWHRFMIAAEVGSVAVYFVSLFFLPTYFGPREHKRAGRWVAPWIREPSSRTLLLLLLLWSCLLSLCRCDVHLHSRIVSSLLRLSFVLLCCDDVVVVLVCLTGVPSSASSFLRRVACGRSL